MSESLASSASLFIVIEFEAQVEVVSFLDVFVSHHFDDKDRKQRKEGEVLV